MKITSTSIIIAAVFIGGAIMLFGSNKDSGSNSTEVLNNVSIILGKQIITINAKGGYFPRITTAKAGMPTIIKVSTNGTFDCSSALVIPSLGYRANLSPSGVTDVEVPPQKAGSTLQGLCSMGMYNFSVNFN